MKAQIACPIPQESDLVDLNWGPKIHIPSTHHPK